MLLSVVMPALDEAAGIEQSLRNLAAVRQAGVEVIVVDGGSGDATVALARPLADQVLSSHRGRAMQMNAGAAAAQGDMLLFLHADTQLPAGVLTLMQRASIDPRHAWGRFDVTIHGRSRWLRLVAFMMNQRSRLTGIATGDQAIFVRRAAFEAVGGFPRQPLMEDIELSRKLRRISPPRCLRQRVRTSGRRWEARGVWHTIVLMWRLRLLYWLGTSAETLAAKYR